jgi:glutamyl-tRNA synthetase
MTEPADDAPGLEALIWKHALYNAYRHRGRAERGAVLAKLVAEQPALRTRIPELLAKVERVVGEVNGLAPEDQRTILETRHPEFLRAQEHPSAEEHPLPPLAGAVQGKVVTRFPPEPNGYPHIGHAKAAILDETYAQRYQGKFILRFDDTNPAKERLEYYRAIRDGLAWLGVQPDLQKNTSDDIEVLYGYAEQLLLDGHAYVCTCAPEVIRENRRLGRVCACRGLNVEVHRRRWDQMLTELAPNSAVVRLRGDMANANTALRDPTLLRIVDAPHPLRERAFRVWPTYDFAAPIEDSLDGVTHALRTKEYELRDPVYFRVLESLRLRAPRLIEFSRLELRGTPVSKRRLRALFEAGVVQDWNDPRLPTLAGLQRRGIRPEAIRAFVLSFGLTKVESQPTWDALESANRKVLDPIAKRLFFVDRPVRLRVANAPPLRATLRLHPSEALGAREIETRGDFYLSAADAAQLKPGMTARLLELYNITVTEARRDLVRAQEVPGDAYDVPLKVQWVTPDAVPFTVLEPQPLFVGDIPNRDSLRRLEGLAEPLSAGLAVGEMVQFVRFGFCRIDSPGVAILAHR